MRLLQYRSRGVRRAFTLVESVVIVFVIALAIPGLVMMIRTSDVAAIDQQRRVAASWLASSVLESVQADATSTHASRGFANINAMTYLTDPADGLYTRLGAITAPYANLGITYEVAVGSPVDALGAVVSPSDLGALREIIVTVTFSDQTGMVRPAEFRTIVGNL